MNHKRNQQEKISLKVLFPFFLLILVIAAMIYPLPYYIEGPGTTENLKQFVTVNDKKDTKSGAFYLTTVLVEKATPFTALISKFSDFKEIISKKELMGTSTNNEYDQMQQYYMESSKNAAVEQALKLAKQPYKLTFKGVYVLQIEKTSNFNGKIQVGDTVTGIDKQTFKSSKEFVDYVKKQKIGQKVTVSYLHNGKQMQATEKLIQLPTDKKAGIGIGLTDHTEIESSVPIKIATSGIGGPSAGLMFTLETYEQLTNQGIRKGHKIAGTGTMNSQGVVGRIGGIDKKVVTASNNHVEIFFAPNDTITKEMKKTTPAIKTNYQEAKIAAKKIGTKMKIVPVKNVQDALDYLAKLKEK